MRKFRLACLLAVTFLIPAAGAVAADVETQGFVPLYDGKDLKGWEVQNGSMSAWKADGPLLSCIKRGGGWLRTAKLYSDFVLRVDWRIPPDGNSGIGLRFPSKGDPAHVGMEIQILDDNAEMYKKMHLVPAQHTGSIYYQVAAKQGAAKPANEWNSYEITCLGPRVKVVLNGQFITDADVDQYTKGAGGHKPLADRPKIGHVGLQSHESRVDFRNIEIKDLTTLTPSGLRYVDLVPGTGPVVPPGATVEGQFTGSPGRWNEVRGQSQRVGCDEDAPVRTDSRPAGRDCRNESRRAAEADYSARARLRGQGAAGKNSSRRDPRVRHRSHQARVQMNRQGERGL